MTDRNPESIIDRGRMGISQWLALLVTVGLNALDGYDVLSISFASPGIAKEWGIDRAVLGWVLSAELLGMAIGSVILGGVADKLGRRTVILGCLVTMTIGMGGACYAAEITTLLAFRLFTGIGIGGMLASINAATAELSSKRWRTLAMAMMVVGYPLGGILGGLAVQELLATGDWRNVFVFGAFITAVFIPIVWFFLPESIAYLVQRRRPGTLHLVNRILTGFGHPAVASLGDGIADRPTNSIFEIFKPAFLSATVIITIAYFAHVVTFYFLLKWVPKLVVDMGFTPAAAAMVLTWVNVGGVAGVAIFGLVATRVGVRPLTILVLICGASMVAWFGRGAHDLATLAIVAAGGGLFANSAIAGLYSLFAQVFPTYVRATGTGFAIGIGRGGAALAPIIAGYLFRAGYSLQTVAMFMAVGSLLSAIALLFLRALDESE